MTDTSYFEPRKIQNFKSSDLESANSSELTTGKCPDDPNLKREINNVEYALSQGKTSRRMDRANRRSADSYLEYYKDAAHSRPSNTSETFEKFAFTNYSVLSALHDDNNFKGPRRTKSEVL